ncbi:MAG TPA: enoyl-ACP reductase [Candidatus Hydrogenedentes bacterium]|nr:enoyl-ACP reductase [Candidatus Hydrogenedentota bacterium]HOL77925.1 enoyl-ACP reductase [Candidatus Hydrogenedentota bacterium]HPO87105.1 enoyl-ACP reductase [Candidatus Hydrogenedentota bacterium]
MLSGKRGVVLGVANERSIAWGCAKACAEHGACLAFTYLGDAQKKRVSRLIESELPGSLLFPCDVARDEDIISLFSSIADAWGTLDFVIHSVAFAHREDLGGAFVKTPRSNFLLALDISAYSFVAVAREASRLMTQGGAIVTMSYFGAEKVVPRYNVMGVAKAALEACVRYLAYDLGPAGIRVNCVSAGPIRTLSSSAIPGMKHMLDIVEKWAPLQRNVTQEEVGRTTAFLVSDLSAGITGEVIHVDSGYNILGFTALGEEGKENARPDENGAAS